MLGFNAMQEAAQQALQSAQDSYTPYPGCSAGMGLVTSDGSVYRGGVIESCAYNPTINPLQAACITLAAKGRRPFSEVWTSQTLHLGSGEGVCQICVSEASPKDDMFAALHVFPKTGWCK